MQNKPSKASRRGFFLSASVAGTAVASVNWLKTPTPAPVAEARKPAPDKGGGYALSEHVKRYYQTARV